MYDSSHSITPPQPPPSPERRLSSNPPPYLLAALAFPLLGVIQVEAVDEVPEDIQALTLLLVRFSLPALLTPNTCFTQHFLGHEDGSPHSHGQRNRIAGTRVDALNSLGYLKLQLRVERVVRQLGHKHPPNGRSERLDHRFQQVMRQWTRHLNVLQFDRDSVGFECADPNRQKAVLILLLEEHCSLLVHHADPDAVYNHLDHGSTPL
jgi:hypothetical protein